MSWDGQIGERRHTHRITEDEIRVYRNNWWIRSNTVGSDTMPVRHRADFKQALSTLRQLKLVCCLFPCVHRHSSVVQHTVWPLYAHTPLGSNGAFLFNRVVIETSVINDIITWLQTRLLTSYRRLQFRVWTWSRSWTLLLGHTLSTNGTSVETGWSSCWWSEILQRWTPCTRTCQTNKPLCVCRMERRTAWLCADWQEKHEMLQRLRSKWHGTHGKRSQVSWHASYFQVWKRVTPKLNTRRKDIHWRIPKATAEFWKRRRWSKWNMQIGKRLKINGRTAQKGKWQEWITWLKHPWSSSKRSRGCRSSKLTEWVRTGSRRSCNWSKRRWWTGGRGSSNKKDKRSSNNKSRRPLTRGAINTMRANSENEERRLGLESKKNQKDEEIGAFIEERRMTEKRDKERLKNVSGSSNASETTEGRTKWQEKTQAILEEFKGIQEHW